MTAILLIVALLPLAQQPTPVQSDEDVLRGRVQAYFEAQAAKDADLALSFWSASASPRPTRETFQTVFGPGEDRYTVVIQGIAIDGDDARVRVSAERVRTVHVNGSASESRTRLLNAELWRKEHGEWKLVRDGPAAEDFADELLAAAPPDRARMLTDRSQENDALLRQVLGQRASQAAAGQQYNKAREIFDLQLVAARDSGDRRTESDALQDAANACYFLATGPAAVDRGALFDQAAAYYQQRLSLARDVNDDDAAAASLLGLATVSYSRGEYTSALARYRDALGIYEKNDEGAEVGRALVSIGNVQLLQGDYDVAADSYRRGLALLVARSDSQGATFARGGMARVFVAQGDLGAALDMYTQVLADARAQMAVDPRASGPVAAALENIGDVYLRLGNFDRARDSFGEARHLVQSRADDAARLDTELGLTELAAGGFDAALADYTEARARYAEAHLDDGVAHAWVGIGFSQSGRHKYDGAIAAYRTAIDLFEPRDRENAARAWLGLSLAQSGKRDDVGALASANTVARIAAAISNDDLAWRAAGRRGEVLRKLSKLDEAAAACRAAQTIVERLTIDAPVDPALRRQLADSASTWSDLAFTLAQAGDARGALAAIEARRAHIRRLQLAAFERDITRGEPSADRIRERDLFREIASARAQLHAETAATHPDESRREHLQQQLLSLLASRRQQQTALYAAVPDLQRLRGQQPLPTADDLDGLVGDGALVIDYLVGDDELLVAAADGSRDGLTVTATVVPDHDGGLNNLIAHAVDPSALGSSTEWRTRAAPIETMVLPAAVSGRLAPAGRLVVVVPDGSLWRIPFEALPIGADDLAARAVVVYATSLTTLAAERRDAMPAVGSAPSASASAPSAGFVAGPDIPTAVRTE
ncbi:MAG: tetratricopeptide repeat protein, partial [Vicinamibacterales bacterium]